MRPLQTGIFDQVLEYAVLGGSVVLLDDVNHRHPLGGVIGHRESHGVRRGVFPFTIARKTVAAAPGIAAVA